jgi:hypothetical protein
MVVESRASSTGNHPLERLFYVSRAPAWWEALIWIVTET